MSKYDILTTALTDQSQVLFLEGLSDQDFWHYATKLASAAPTTKVEIEQYLECELEQKRCILPLATLREVVPPPHQITLLPSIPAWMPGVTAWRGETIAAVDLDAYLRLGPTQIRSDYILLVIQQNEITLGLFVATVRSIPTLDQQQISPPEQAIAQYPHLAAGAIVGTYANALILNTGIILTDIVQHIREAAAYG
ncbi:MAG TPA: chemotaxis protein CheW [Ktedonobacteraceae bacterium]